MSDYTTEPTNAREQAPFADEFPRCPARPTMPAAACKKCATGEPCKPASAHIPPVCEDCGDRAIPSRIDDRIPDHYVGRYCWTCAMERKTGFAFGDLGASADLPAPEHIIPGLVIKGGTSVLFSKSGVGKSTLLYAMLRALATGGDFLGQRVSRTRALLYTEDNQGVVSEQVKRFGIPRGQHVSTASAPVAKSPDIFADMAAKDYRRNGGDFGLIVLDTIASFVRVQDTNAYGEVGDAMRYFRKLAQDTGAGILLLHHVGKAGGDGNDAAIGSISFTAQADQRLSLNVSNGQRRLTVSGKYNPGPLAGVHAYELSGDTAVIVAAEADKSAAEADAIVESLADGPRTLAQIRDALPDSLSDKAIKRRIERLIDDGQAVEARQYERGKHPALYALAE